MVRSRKRSHLSQLIGWGALDHTPIVEQYGSDYAFRIFITKAEWAELCKAAAEEIHYSNFKKEAAKNGDPDFTKALSQIWSILYRLQPDPVEQEASQRLDSTMVWADSKVEALESAYTGALEDALSYPPRSPKHTFLRKVADALEDQLWRQGTVTTTPMFKPYPTNTPNTEESNVRPEDTSPETESQGN